MPVRIALVGADDAARAVAETLQNVDEARVVAVCASSKTAIEYSKAETLARRVKAQAFRDVKTMLRNETPDALCVVASGKARRDAQLLGMQNGTDIFLIPPFATSLQSAQTLLQSAQPSRARLWIAHHERFFDSAESARKILSARNSAPVSCFGSWKMAYADADKTTNFLASSTRLIGLLRFLAGDIKSVFARSSALSTSLAASLTLNLGFASGVNGAFVISESRVGARRENVLHFQAPNQNLEWREQVITLQRGNETQRIEYSNDARNDARREELRLWIQSVQSGRRTLAKSSPQDSLQTLRVALAIAQSAKTNKPVRIGN